MNSQLVPEYAVDDEQIRTFMKGIVDALVGGHPIYSLDDLLLPEDHYVVCRIRSQDSVVLQFQLSYKLYVIVVKKK